jgi:hypothetical protein
MCFYNRKHFHKLIKFLIPKLLMVSIRLILGTEKHRLLLYKIGVNFIEELQLSCN